MTTTPGWQQKPLKIAGFDPGRNYVAFAVVRGDYERGFRLYRHGMIYTPDLGDTASFGRGLSLWPGFFDVFLRRDLKVSAFAVERFKNQRFGNGASAEDINLQIPGMLAQHLSHAFLIRNVDWKGWFKREVHPQGSEAHFATSTPHEADAAGIALYTASVLLPRRLRIQPRA